MSVRCVLLARCGPDFFQQTFDPTGAVLVLSAEPGGNLSGNLMKGLRLRRVRIGDDQRPAQIPALAYGRIDGNSSEKRDPEASWPPVLLHRGKKYPFAHRNARR